VEQVASERTQAAQRAYPLKPLPRLSFSRVSGKFTHCALWVSEKFTYDAPQKKPVRVFVQKAR